MIRGFAPKKGSITMKNATSDLLNWHITTSYKETCLKCQLAFVTFGMFAIAKGHQEGYRLALLSGTCRPLS